MAISRQQNWTGQQRVDLPHLRSLESAVAADFDVLGRAVAGPMACVVKGFTIATAGVAGALASSLRLSVAGGTMVHPLATESGSWVQISDTAASELLSSSNANVEGSFTPNATNYVGIDLRRIDDPTTSASVMFIDSNSGLEAARTVPLARTLRYKVIITTIDFSSLPHLCPVAKVVTDASNQVVSVADARQMLYRLGRGGASPDPVYSFTWPAGRKEGPTLADAFVGGDKLLTSQKEWGDALMSRIWELGGGERWFSSTTDRDVKMCFGQPVLGNGDNFLWTSGTSTIQWISLFFVFANSTATFNDVTNGSTTLADGECLYVDVDRTVNRTGGTALVVQKANRAVLGSPTIPGSRFVVAWRKGSEVYFRDKQYEAGRLFGTVATPTALGIVQLADSHPSGTPGTPRVIPLDSNLTLKYHPASGTDVSAAWFKARGAGIGVSAEGGAGAGRGLYAAGGATGTGGLGSGQAIWAEAFGPGAEAIRATSSTGNAIRAFGGTDADAIYAEGGSDSAGVNGVGGSNGAGLLGTGGTGAPGVMGTAGVGSSGVEGVGGTEVDGVKGFAGATVGASGVRGEGNASSIGDANAIGGSGVYGKGAGTSAAGVRGIAGASGAGLFGSGGTGNGAGVIGAGTGAGFGGSFWGGPTSSAAVFGTQLDAGSESPGIIAGNPNGDGVAGIGGATSGRGGVFTGRGTGAGVRGTGAGTGVGGHFSGASGAMFGEVTSSSTSLRAASTLLIGKNTQDLNGSIVSMQLLHSKGASPEEGWNVFSQRTDATFDIELVFARWIGGSFPIVAMGQTFMEPRQSSLDFGRPGTEWGSVQTKKIVTPPSTTLSLSGTGPTVSPAGRTFVRLNSNTGSGNMTLNTAGALDGQVLTIINVGGTGTCKFTTGVGNVKVKSDWVMGAAAGEVSISFIFDGATGTWYETGRAG